MQSRLLSFSELKGSHTGENQAAHLYSVYKGYGIVNKVRILIQIESLSYMSDLNYYCISVNDVDGRQCICERQDYGGFINNPCGSR